MIYRRFRLTNRSRATASPAKAAIVRPSPIRKAGRSSPPSRTRVGRPKGEHLLPDAELGRFVAQVEAGRISPGTVLLAERLDRLSRRPVAEAMAWVFNLTSRGIQFAIADKGRVFSTNMSLEEFLTASLSVNTGNEESEKKSERVAG